VAVPSASISTTFPSAASVGNWFHQKTAISYMPFFTFITYAYLATLDVISFVLGLQSNFRPALQSAARLALQSAKRLILNAIYLDYYFSASTAPWVLTRGEAHGAYYSLIAHTTALHCVWFLPFRTRGGGS
jgi:hypothetical protein